MGKEQKYILETKCYQMEDHDGERWITQKEFDKIKEQAGTISPGCSVCSLKVKDEEGHVLFTKEGC